MNDTNALVMSSYYAPPSTCMSFPYPSTPHTPCCIHSSVQNLFWKFGKYTSLRIY